jgi:hypothetical protein
MPKTNPTIKIKGLSFVLFKYTSIKAEQCLSIIEEFILPHFGTVS